MMLRNSFQPVPVVALVAVSVVVLTIACASTPDSRILEQQSLFDSYAEDVQSNIRLG